MNRCLWDFEGGTMEKNPPANSGDESSNLSWENPLEETWQFTPVFLPEEAHGQRSLAGYSP